MRSLLVLLTLILFFIFFSPIMLILFYLRKKHMDLSMNVTRNIVRKLISVMLFFSGTRIKKEGLENIPDEAALFVSNHRSYYDTISSYMFMNRPTGFVAKKELKSIPFLSHWMELMGCVFLDRNDVKEGFKAILKAIDTIKEGYSIVIFPEGTRNRSENMDVPLKFREGSLKIASRSHCMVVPVAVKNTENCLEAHFPWVRANTVRITFLKPFYVDDIPLEERKFSANFVRGLIEEDLKRPM